MVEGWGHYRGERFEAALGNHSLEFGSGAIDLINFVNYTSVSLSLLSPGTFREFQASPIRAPCPALLLLTKLAADAKTRWQ